MQQASHKSTQKKFSKEQKLYMISIMKMRMDYKKLVIYRL